MANVDFHDIRKGVRSGKLRGSAKIMQSLQRIKDRLAIHKKKIELLKHATDSTNPIAAFVTFKTEEGLLRAEHAYPDNFLVWLCQSRRKRLGGEYRVSLRRAPQPGDIIWEHLGVSNASRAMRILLTTVFIFFLLGISAVFVFLFEDANRQFKREYPTTDCQLLDDVMNKDLVVCAHLHCSLAGFCPRAQLSDKSDLWLTRETYTPNIDPCCIALPSLTILGARCRVQRVGAMEPMVFAIRGGSAM